MKNKKNIISYILKITGGAFIGLINGFFGGGGGMLCVPYLEKLYNIDNKKSHASALVVILPLSVASLIVYSLSNEVDYISGIYVSIGSILGGIVGSVLLRKLNGKVVRCIFAIIMLTAGIKMVLSW